MEPSQPATSNKTSDYRQDVMGNGAMTCDYCGGPAFCAMYGVEPCRHCRMEQALREVAAEAAKFSPLKEAEWQAHLASCPECQAHYARTNRMVPSTELRTSPELPAGVDAGPSIRRQPSKGAPVKPKPTSEAFKR